MAKKIIQDVLKRPEERKRKEFESSEILSKTKKGGLFKRIILFLTIMAIIFLGVVALINLSSATIKITPHQEFININEQLKSGFEIIQTEQEYSQTASSTEMSISGQKARGQIVVYNTYSSSQKLITQTRFETPDGKIYKIQNPIVIPANGSLEATVYAEKPGPEYNIGLIDFTVPGLKGTARYEKIYARSKTAMKGGTKENSEIISEKDITSVKNSLKEKLESYLREKIVQQKPADYLLYKNAIKIEFFDDTNNPKAGDMADKFTLKEKGITKGYLIKRSDLSKILVDKYFPDYKSEKGIETVNLEDLEFNWISKNEGNTEITFNLKGNVHFAWNIDTKLLADSLMNVKNKKYKEVFKNFPEIERAEIIFRPVWWPWIPDDPFRIHFETILE